MTDLLLQYIIVNYTRTNGALDICTAQRDVRETLGINYLTWNNSAEDSQLNPKLCNSELRQYEQKIQVYGKGRR